MRPGHVPKIEMQHREADNCVKAVNPSLLVQALFAVAFTAVGKPYLKAEEKEKETEMTPELEAKIREEFEKHLKEKDISINFGLLKEAFKAGFLAGRASALKELEQTCYAWEIPVAGGTWVTQVGMSRPCNPKKHNVRATYSLPPEVEKELKK